MELMGGTPEQCMDAGSTVLMNLLGLVCDPVGGLVEYPCQNRNAAGVANALIAAELSLSGVKQLIPFDEMLETMYAVGRRIPIELRDPDEIREKWYAEPMALPEVKCYNPAFDVTDHTLIAGIVTEKGICRAPYTESLAALFKK